MLVFDIGGHRNRLSVMVGHGVPKWVGAKWFRGSPDSIYDTANKEMPIPWDENLRREQIRMIRAFAERYRGVPHLAFFHIAGPSSIWFEKAVRSQSAKWLPKTAIAWQFWGSTAWPKRKTTDYEGSLRLAMDSGATYVEVYDDDLRQPELAKIAEQIDAEMKRRLDAPGAGNPASPLPLDGRGAGGKGGPNACSPRWSAGLPTSPMR